MSGSEGEQASQRSQEHDGSASRPHFEDEQHAIEVLQAGFNKPENDAETSKRAAQTGRKRLLDDEEPTVVGKERIAKGETRLRVRKDFADQFLPGKVRNFRLATAAATAHAEDCYMMWCFWNKNMELKESLFRYSPSLYLNDTELEQALKKITTADEMEEYLKERYKTKRDERPSKRKFNRITSNNSKSADIQSSLHAALEETPDNAEPSKIEEEPRPPKQQQQQQQPAPDTVMNVDAGPSKPTSPSKQAEGSKEAPSKETVALLHAAKLNVPSEIDLLISKKADVNGKALETGESVLMIAAQQNDAEFIKEFLGTADKYNQHVKIDAKDDLGWTALMHAATKGNNEIVSALLEKGADVNSTDRNGHTALMCAVVQGSLENVQNLIWQNALVNSRDTEGCTALIHAAMHGRHEIVNFLCLSGASTESSDFVKYRAALIHAARNGYLESLRPLLECGRYCSETTYAELLREVDNALEEATRDKESDLMSRLAEVSEYLKAKEQKRNETNRDLSLECSEPINVNNFHLKDAPELIDIVRKATIDGKLLDTYEIHRLLLNARALTISTVPPSEPPAGSLFIYDKTVTPNYKNDRCGLGKESHTNLKIEKEARIKVYYGTKLDPPLQRRCYSLIKNEMDSDDHSENMVVVHYLLPQTSARRYPKSGGETDELASGSLKKVSLEASPKPLSTLSEQGTIRKRLQGAVDGAKKLAGWKSSAKTPSAINEADKNLDSADEQHIFDEHVREKDFGGGSNHDIDDDSTINLRSLIAIGARFRVPGLDADVFCDAVNERCDHPPDGCEIAAKSAKIYPHMLLSVTEEIMGMEFDDLSIKRKQKWEEAVDNHKSAAIIRKLRDLVVEHLKGTQVPEDIINAFLTATTDDLSSMALALTKLRKISTISQKLLTEFVNMFTKAEVWWREVQFVMIRDAVVENDISYARGLIEEALTTGLPKGNKELQSI